MRYALALEYCGAGFKGWQSQVNQRTVQATLEAALSKLADEPIAVVAAGRTDTGVHAAKQVVHFDSTREYPLHNWLFGCNRYLPSDVAVQWVQPTSADFHARFSATARHYRYFICHQRSRSALWPQHMTWHCRPLTLSAMQAAAAYLLGEHDFSSFRDAQCQSHSATRRIDLIKLEQSGNLLRLDIRANAFLHHMVRNIVGSLLAVGEGRQPVEWLQAVLAARDRTQAGVTAPAQGLYLVDVRYPEHFYLPQTPLFTLGAF